MKDIKKKKKRGEKSREGKKGNPNLNYAIMFALVLLGTENVK